MTISIPSPDLSHVNVGNHGKQPEIVGFAVDQLSITFAKMPSSKMGRLSQCNELLLADGVTLKRVYPVSKSYRGGTFEGHGIHVNFDYGKNRPVQLVFHGEACARFSDTQLLKFISFLEIRVGLTDGLVSHVDHA